MKDPRLPGRGSTCQTEEEDTMAIKVRFDKAGYYHPAFGRLGRGDKGSGAIYTLP